MCRQVLRQWFADAVRRLVGREVADAREHFEPIGRGDEIGRALGGHAQQLHQRRAGFSGDEASKVRSGAIDSFSSSGMSVICGSTVAQ